MGAMVGGMGSTPYMVVYSKGIGLKFPFPGLGIIVLVVVSFFLCSPRILGERIQFDVRIFFKGVETTNQLT